jgi:hypothetical protein
MIDASVGCRACSSSRVQRGTTGLVGRINPGEDAGPRTSRSRAAVCTYVVSSPTHWRRDHPDGKHDVGRDLIGDVTRGRSTLMATHHPSRRLAWPVRRMARPSCPLLAVSRRSTSLHRAVSHVGPAQSRRYGDGHRGRQGVARRLRRATRPPAWHQPQCARSPAVDRLST